MANFIVEGMGLDLMLGREGNVPQILHLPDAPEIDAERAVMLGEREHRLLEIAPQQLSLPLQKQPFWHRPVSARVIFFHKPSVQPATRYPPGSKKQTTGENKDAAGYL